LRGRDQNAKKVGRNLHPGQRWRKRKISSVRRKTKKNKQSLFSIKKNFMFGKVRLCRKSARDQSVAVGVSSMEESL